MNPDELYSADPEKLLKRAMSDVRFARSGFEAGHEAKALLLAIRGIEKLLLFHLMERNIPFTRDSTSLRELIRNLVNTPVHTTEREELCSVLDAFQFEQEDEVMDVIQSGDQYKTLDELDDADVEEMASEEFEESREEEQEETLEDWENDEWGPEGWSKEGEVNVEGFDMEAFEPDTMDEPDENDTSSVNTTSEMEEALPDPEDIPPRKEMYENALSLFKDLSRLVDGTD